VFCAVGGERAHGAKQTGLPSTQPPSRDYLFGTDTLGRMCSRVIVGAREVFTARCGAAVRLGRYVAQG
jgi:ABC-type dipeptide/oligopeptide/nickel transport system permease subunit